MRFNRRLWLKWDRKGGILDCEVRVVLYGASSSIFLTWHKFKYSILSMKLVAQITNLRRTRLKIWRSTAISGWLRIILFRPLPTRQSIQFLSSRWMCFWTFEGSRTIKRLTSSCLGLEGIWNSPFIFLPHGDIRFGLGRNILVLTRIWQDKTTQLNYLMCVLHLGILQTDRLEKSPEQCAYENVSSFTDVCWW